MIYYYMSMVIVVANPNIIVILMDDVGKIFFYTHSLIFSKLNHIAANYSLK